MASLLSVNGIDVTDAVIHLPRVGVWHADLNINLNKRVLTGRAELQFGSQALLGFFTQGGVDVSNRLRARVVGGNGALSTILSPKGYSRIPLQIPILDAIRDCGEVGLAQSSDQVTLQTSLEAWSRMSVSAGTVIAQLVKAIDTSPAWRILPDGTLWIGFESWKNVTLPNATLIGSEPEKARLKVASSDPNILPGQTFNFTPPGQAQVSQKVSYVRHLITPSSCETLIFYETS